MYRVGGMCAFRVGGWWSESERGGQSRHFDRFERLFLNERVTQVISFLNLHIHAGGVPQRGRPALEAAAGGRPVARPSVLQPRLPVGRCVSVWIELNFTMYGCTSSAAVLLIAEPAHQSLCVSLNCILSVRNPLGVWGVGGLFLAPVWPLLRHCFPGWLLGAPPPPSSTDAADVARRVVLTLFDGMGWVGAYEARTVRRVPKSAI